MLGKKNKKGYPWVMMLVLYIIAIVPVFVDMGLDDLISLMMIPTMILNLINNCLMFKLLKKYPAAWKNSFFHMPKWAFNITIVLAIIADLLISVSLFTTLEAGDQYFLIGMIVFLFGFSFYRIKAGKIDLKECHEYGNRKIEDKVKKLGKNDDIENTLINMKVKELGW